MGDKVDDTTPSTELVRHVINTQSTAVRLRFQYTNLFYDQNVESWGWNRQESESRLSHLARLLRSDYYETSKDHAMPDLTPCGGVRLSENYKTLNCTYFNRTSTNLNY